MEIGGAIFTKPSRWFTGLARPTYFLGLSRQRNLSKLRTLLFLYSQAKTLYNHA
jgi:hypothetical protein